MSIFFLFFIAENKYSEKIIITKEKKVGSYEKYEILYFITFLNSYIVWLTQSHVLL